MQRNSRADLVGGGQPGVVVVARQDASGAFGGELLFSIPATDLFAQDLDGDGTAEAVLIGPDRIRALWFEALSPVEVALVDTEATTRGTATLADIDGDGAAATETAAYVFLQR